MTRSEMIHAVQAIYDVNGTEDEIHRLVTRLDAAVPNALIDNLIFNDFSGLTPQQVVDEALQREADYRQQTGMR